MANAFGDTDIVRLSPAFLDALRKLVPPRRRMKIRYVVGLAVIAVVGVLGADASTREFVAARWLSPSRGSLFGALAVAAHDVVASRRTPEPIATPVAETPTTPANSMMKATAAPIVVAVPTTDWTPIAPSAVPSVMPNPPKTSALSRKGHPPPLPKTPNLTPQRSL